MALGGLATTNKGITTPEGLIMAKKKFQLDDKDADTNGDGKLSTREKEIGRAVQRNVDTEVTDDDKVQMSHGGMATYGSSCGCGAMSEEDCMCGMMDGLMGFDGISGNPIPVGSNAENVRDDIDAKLSTDEYVLPAHVVKWHGLKHIQMMQSEAEMGLMSMQMDGLIQHVEEKSHSESSKDGEVSSKSNSKQKGAEAEAEAPEEIYSGEGVDVEVATVKVDDHLTDEGDKELRPKTSKLAGIVKKKKYV